jgi:hypothetical protein
MSADLSRELREIAWLAAAVGGLTLGSALLAMAAVATLELLPAIV